MEDDAPSSESEESNDSFIRRKMRAERDLTGEALARKELVERLMRQRVAAQPITLRPGSIIQKKTKEQRQKEKLRAPGMSQKKTESAPAPIPKIIEQTSLVVDTQTRTTAPKRDASWHHNQTKKYTQASLRGEELLTQLDRVEKLMTDKRAIYKVAAALSGDMGNDTCYALAKCARFSKSMRRVVAAHRLNAREANLIWKFPDELHEYLGEMMQWGSIPFSRLLRVKWGMDEGRDLPTLLRSAGFSWPEGLSKFLLIPKR